MSKRDPFDRGSVFSSLLGEVRELHEGSAEQQNIPLEKIAFNPKQPRKYLDEGSLAALTDSIRQHGVLEPVLVRPVGEGFELIAGERRTRAAKAAGLRTIPAVVLEIDEVQALEIAVIENLQREDLNPVEETDAVLTLLSIRSGKTVAGVAEGVRQLYDESRGRAGNNVISKDERELFERVFASLGRFTASSFYTNRLPLLKMPRDLIEAVRQGRLHYTKARKLAKVSDEDLRGVLLERTLREDLSVAALEAAIREALQRQTHENAMHRTLREVKRQLSPTRVEQLSAEDRRRVSSLLEELRALLS